MSTAAGYLTLELTLKMNPWPVPFDITAPIAERIALTGSIESNMFDAHWRDWLGDSEVKIQQ